MSTEAQCAAPGSDSHAPILSGIARRFEALRGIARQFDRPWHRSSGKWIGRVFLVAMIFYLFDQLQRMGWARVWAARPTSPAFYLLLLASYLTLPIADALIYGRLWKIGFWSAIPALLRKRIYNAAFVGYSGEVYLMLWARRRLALSDRTLAHMIKDSNILSAAVSTLASAAVLLVLIVQLPVRAIDGEWIWWGAATLAMAAAIPFAAFHRGKFMLLGAGAAATVFAVHLARFAVVQGLQVGLWSIQPPGAGARVLIGLLAAQLLVSRIPLLPNRDLLFVGVGIGLSSNLALPQATVAGMLVTISLFQQAMHLLTYILTSFGSAAARQ